MNSPEQTPESRPARDRRVGTFTFGAVLVICGALMLVSMFFPSLDLTLALTLLWGSGNLSGRVHSTAPSLLERAGTALTKWTDAWPQAWEEALSGFSGLFDNFGVSPRNDLTQGGTHP